MACLPGSILGPALTYKSYETHQNGEGLPGLRGICRWSPGDFVAAGTQGRGGGDGR